MAIVKNICIVLVMLTSVHTQLLCVEKQHATQNKIIELKEYYNGKGAILHKSAKVILKRADWIERFTPTFSDAVTAENIIKQKVSDYEDLKHKITTYYRFYVGFINTKGQKVILVYMFKFETPEDKEIYKNWREGFIFGGGSYFEDNTIDYVINLSTKELSD